MSPERTSCSVPGSVSRRAISASIAPRRVAAKMRALRPPDPYKNKGIRYVGELLRKKVGKTGASGGK